MGLAGFNRARRILAEGGTVEQHRFQHRSGRVEYAAPGSKRHAIFMQSGQWQKVPLSTGRAVAATPAPDPAPQPAALDLSSFTVAELRAMASERGISVPSKALKADIITLLEG